MSELKEYRVRTTMTVSVYTDVMAKSNDAAKDVAASKGIAAWEYETDDMCGLSAESWVANMQTAKVNTDGMSVQEMGGG